MLSGVLFSFIKFNNDREPLKIIHYGAEDGNIYNLALLEFYYILIDDSFNDSVHGLWQKTVRQ